jgi:subtilisin family serine protease
MTLPLMLGWLLIAFFAPGLLGLEDAQAVPVIRDGQLSFHAPPALPAGFRGGFGPRFGGSRFGGHAGPRHFRGGRLEGQRRGRDYHPGYTRHHRGRRLGGDGPSSSTNNRPRRPSRRHPPGLPIYPDLPAGAAATILGAGGSGRPAAAPRFTRAPGQRAADVAAALLNNKRHRPRELLCEVPAQTAEGLRETIAREYGVTVRDAGVLQLAGVRIWHITIAPGQDLRALLERLLQDPRVLTAQPNYIYTPVQGPPPGKGASNTGAAVQPSRSAGGNLPTGAGVKLAVIDSCVERDHAELQGAIAASYDAIQQDTDACQPDNHGTAVASLIAGRAQVRGTATGASILPVRAFAFSNEENEVAATSQDIAAAMNWAAKSDVKVMNLSFTGPADPLVERAAAAAYLKGIVLVAAAGNAGPDSPPLYPAAYPEVIAVTATNGRREIYSAANRGKHVSVSARGVDVLVAHAGNGYGTESGTSFAAAWVSGIVACLLERRPKAGPDEIRAALQKTATGYQDAKSSGAGTGSVNALAAVAFVETSVPR